MTMLEFLQDAVYTVTGKTNVTYDTDFIKDLKLNSFDIVNIIAIFEQRFNIDISTRDLWQIRTVSDLLDYVARLDVTL